MTTETVNGLLDDPRELSVEGVEVVAGRVKQRDTGSDTYLYVLLEAKAPRDADAWPAEAVQSIRERLQKRADEPGVEPRLVVVFVAQPGTGDPSAFPDDDVSVRGV